MPAGLSKIDATNNVEYNGADFFRPNTFTPEIQLVTVTMTNQVGNYRRVGDVVFFDIEIDYNSLNTADGSAITIGGLPFNIATTGHIFGTINYQDSTGLNLTAGDELHISGNAATTFIVFTDSAGALVGYNSGKISASGQIILSGHYITDGA